MKTLTTYVKRDPIIKLDRAEIGKYLQLPKYAPTETVSKPPEESSQEVSQKWFLKLYIKYLLSSCFGPILKYFSFVTSVSCNNPTI